MNVDDLLRTMPKAELHLHLEGAVDALTFVSLAGVHGLVLPSHDDPLELYEYDTLTDFLTVYSLVCSAVRTRDDFARVTYECLTRCAGSGARYVEFFFSPESHLEFVDYPTMLAGVVRGMEEAATDVGVESRVIPAINRELGAARAVEFVEMVQAHRYEQVIGVGMDFNEVGFPPEDYVEAFALATSYGLGRTSHAGEVGPAANIGNGIELLSCDRVDHGYNVVDDPELMAKCAASQIPFTVCPTTTTYTTDYRDLTDLTHPIRRMADAGLALTINSDDPAMFGVDLAHEYSVLHHSMGFTLAELRRCALNGIEAAWIDEGTKATWRAEWASETDRLFAQASIGS
jgi:adenosine deaminase